MALKTTDVNKCLDKRLLVFGFEIFDVLIVLFVLSVLNLLFAASTYKLFLVWVPSVCLGLILRFGKQNKPDKYLLHLMKYQFQPGILSAFREPKVVIMRNRRKENE